MPVGQGAVAAGVGVDLGAVEADAAEAAELVLARDLQHLHEHGFKFLAETPPEGGQGVVVGMAVAGEVAKRQRVVGRPLDLAAGITAGGIAVDQQRQQGRRVIGGTAPATIGPLQLAQVQSFDHLGDVARQMPLGQPLLHRGRQQEVDVAVDRSEVAHRHRPSGLLPLLYRDAHTARRRESPTGC